jgi:hypothetical protein
MWLLINEMHRTASEVVFLCKVGNYNVAGALKLYLSADLMATAHEPWPILAKI